jgi:hypothetical protein
MSNPFKPSVKIEINQETYTIRAGFGEVAEFEREVGQPLLEAMGGIPSVDAVSKFIAIGLRWKLGRKKATQKWVCDAFNRDPAAFTQTVEAIGKLIEEYFPAAKEEQDDDVPLGEQEDEGET